MTYGLPLELNGEDPSMKVEVGRRAVAGVADQTDRLTPADPVAHSYPNRVFLHVGVQCVQAVAHIDHYRVAIHLIQRQCRARQLPGDLVFETLAHVDDLAVGRRQDLFSVDDVVARVGWISDDERASLIDLLPVDGEPLGEPLFVVDREWRANVSNRATTAVGRNVTAAGFQRRAQNREQGIGVDRYLTAARRDRRGKPIGRDGGRLRVRRRARHPAGFLQ